MERVRKQSCGNLEQNATRQKDGGEMLIAIVLDQPLSEAQALVDNLDAFMLRSLFFFLVGARCLSAGRT